MAHNNTYNDTTLIVQDLRTIHGIHNAAGDRLVAPERGEAVPNATGAGDVVARLNDLLGRLRVHGLIKS